MPNSIKIGQTIAEIWRFNCFKTGILDLLNSNLLMVGAVKGHILHQRTKFYKDRSNHYGDIVIFVIFQDGGRRHFGFSKIRILTIDPL